MRRKLVTRVCACVLITQVCSPAPAWAWGKQGHRIVGHIAESRLTPEARAAVAKLLGEGKHLSDDDVANWADHIRGEFPETFNWHFVDIPVETGDYVRGRDCKYGECVIERIERFKKVLASKTARANDRQRALKFLVHFVGDMHQPLHCAERRDSKGVPDQGGNLCIVHFQDETNTTNLHKVWDTQIIEHFMGETDPLSYAEKLREQITVPKAAAWKAGSVEDWAIESHRLAKSHVYAGVAADGPPTRLGPEYVARGREVTDEQLARAGVRLSEILNESLK